MEEDHFLNQVRINDCEFTLFEDTLESQRGINNKILQWTLRNLDTL